MVIFKPLCCYIQDQELKGARKGNMVANGISAFSNAFQSKNFNILYMSRELRKFKKK